MGYSPPPSSDLTHYVSLTEAVQLGYGAYQTLRSWISDGTLPAVKIGSRVKVLRADLDSLATPVRQSSFEDVESAVERIVASAPPLSDSQVRRLASLFGGTA
ncbi:helix-turn-helix domain-containing protein [Rhodococcus pyridinivorans]|uniref:Excisionase family DNA-binding protein n=1 Tax=Rhodococcus pyridinivorans AK37 TaxID=1114960 RepID=H0JM65_9NOCA|nr:helix-turn-helix domain-containing protein [Rhodococcus pyridinivorans]EHK85782.1 excisionase family DNA-binding protein [Rhodococcus pyridinivorans AK37]MCD2141363.1 helix-turn-helix domain-containing protein [Rhodococcus pyridinivorans]